MYESVFNFACACTLLKTRFLFLNFDWLHSFFYRLHELEMAKKIFLLQSLVSLFFISIHDGHSMVLQPVVYTQFRLGLTRFQPGQPEYLRLLRIKVPDVC